MQTNRSAYSRFTQYSALRALAMPFDVGKHGVWHAAIEAKMRAYSCIGPTHKTGGNVVRQFPETNRAER